MMRVPEVVLVVSRTSGNPEWSSMAETRKCPLKNGPAMSIDHCCPGSAGVGIVAFSAWGTIGMDLAEPWVAEFHEFFGLC